VSAGSRRAAPLLLGLALLLAGCGQDWHFQSPLHAGGAGARDALQLWRWLLGILTVVWIVVMALFAWVLVRGWRDTVARPVNALLWLGVGGALVPLGVLTFILLLTLNTLSAEAARESGDPDLSVRVTALRWWWKVEYEHPEPQQRVTTANEIHIPVGRSVRLMLDSHDVIHSFWIPGLEMKKDMFPGRDNELWLVADSAGVYRGQCAEFCGIQHANMAFIVVAQEPAEFDAWYASQLEEAKPPETALAQQGERVFLQGACAMCHAVKGTQALATVGPDLTHLASRRTLAAGTLVNNRGNLGGWIMNPQSIKPGSHMPNMDLEAGELLALLAYLEQLR
jgi:cytochrome c oxidase subunit II